MSNLSGQSSLPYANFLKVEVVSWYMILSLSLNCLFSFSAISKLSAIDLFFLSTCSLLLQSDWEHLHQCVDSEDKSTFVANLMIISHSSALHHAMKQAQTAWIRFLESGTNWKKCSRGASRSSCKGEFNRARLQVIQNKKKHRNVDFRSSAATALLYKSTPVCMYFVA